LLLRPAPRAWFLVLAVLLLAALLAAEAWRRHGLYWYEVRDDYSYEFDPAAHHAIPVQVSTDGFEWTAPSAGHGTALLELSLDATLAGGWFEPCLEITIGSQRERQCFERGAAGRRYVLLPPGEPGVTSAVQLQGRHLRWPLQDARVLWFPTPSLDGARVLVLAPHPDDAEIAAFGLYASSNAFVATMTAGNYVDGLYGDLGLDAAAQDRLRGEVRVWDSLAVPQLGGVPPGRTVNLGYRTYTLKQSHDTARTPGAAPAGEPIGDWRQGAVDELLGGRTATADWDSFVADLVALVVAIRPDVIVTPHPALDDHTDHQYTTIAVLEALEQLQDRHVTLLLYNNHHRLAEHYPYGPSTAVVTLPPWFDGPRFAGVMSYPLDSSLQLRKLFALEAMHDLRAPPLRLDTGAPAGVLLERLKQAADLVRRDPFGDYSYFRRAVRPNELFFVYPPEARPSPDDLTSPVKR
jgi:LmbE family N-acetylglucosaminyl deacetylase